MVIQADWRQPARAIRLLVAPPEARIGVLLDALVIWDRRARGEPPGSCVPVPPPALRRSVASASAPSPDPGSTGGWTSVSPGASAGERGVRGATKGLKEPGSSAGFFGLRPDSDRVTFVIDIPEAANRWGTTQSTRFEEAVEQLVHFEAAPEDTASTSPSTRHRWSPAWSLSGLTNLARARQSLLARAPGGGTNRLPSSRLSSSTQQAA